MSGGEPLSEERMEQVANELLNPPPAGQSYRGHRMDVLRAFAREIQAGQPKSVDSAEVNLKALTASRESCRSLQKERDELAELIECDPGDSGTPCGNCRGCARSECRSLSEALEMVMAWKDSPVVEGAFMFAAIHGYKVNPTQAMVITAMFGKVTDALAAYRSSEAGRGLTDAGKALADAGIEVADPPGGEP